MDLCCLIQLAAPGYTTEETNQKILYLPCDLCNPQTDLYKCCQCFLYLYPFCFFRLTLKAEMKVEKKSHCFRNLTSVTNWQRFSWLCLMTWWTREWRQSFYKKCVYAVWRVVGQQLTCGNNRVFVWSHTEWVAVCICGSVYLWRSKTPLLSKHSVVMATMTLSKKWLMSVFHSVTSLRLKSD